MGGQHLEPCFHGASVSGGPIMAYPPFKKLTQCELLFPFQLSDKLTVAIGQLWPTSDRILHGKLINEGFVKVQVDNVIKGYEKMPVLEVTKTEEIKRVGDMLHSFVQWPKDAVKIVSKEISDKSLSGLRMPLSPGLSSHSGASPQTQTEDVATASYCYPELMQVQELPQDIYQQQMQATYAPNPGPTQQMRSIHVSNPDQVFVDPEVTTALERTKNRPGAIQVIVELLSRSVGDNHSIEISSPTMMYPETVRDIIPYVELLQLFSNGWLDITVLHGFEMYFYEAHNSRCAFFNPHHIKGDSCIKNPEGVHAHIIEMLTFHTDKTFFVAPYLANNHWTLIIICPSSERGYIIDSIRREKDQHNYLLTSVIEEAFGFPFIWDMVKGKQQKNDGECGFVVIKHMYEFVNSIQHDFKDKKLTQCELLFPFQLSDELTVATGQIWPTSDRILHGKLINEGCVKVQVDNVIKGCEKMPVHEVTKTEEIKSVGDMLHSFVQWPRDALKILNKETSGRSLSASRATPSPDSLSHVGASPQPQTGDVTATSCYHPEIEQDDLYELQVPIQQNIDQMSFMNTLMQVEVPQNVYEQQNQATHAPNPSPTQQMQSTHVPNPELTFIDPEVTTSLERTKTRPRAIQDMVKILSRCVGDNHSIEISSPARMYPRTVRDSIPYVELLQLFSNDWLDISVMHGFAMYFHASHNSQCAFFNPHHIKGDSCSKSSEAVQAHILDMFTFHTDKTFFVAPYIANHHWTLIILCPSTERGYIIDSVRREKDQHDYLLTSVIDEAFGFPFIWDMVKCKQQKNSWECGFMVIKHMYEFVNSIQHDFPSKLWNEKGCLPQKEIDKLILDLTPEFINSVFPTGQRHAWQQGYLSTPNMFGGDDL